MIALRHQHVALRHGDLYWVHVGFDSMMFLREHANERIPFHAARADHPPVTLPLWAVGIESLNQLIPFLGEPGTAMSTGWVTNEDTNKQVLPYPEGAPSS